MQCKLWIGGNWKGTGENKLVTDPYTGKTVSISENAGDSEIEEAIRNSILAFSTYKKTSRYARSALLKKIALGIESRKKDFIDSIIEESGKPIKFAEIEVNRAISSFNIASEETKRFGGEVVPLDWESSGTTFEPMVSFFTPRGILLAITPFNFPLNLVVHKLAPALAIGASIILKPAPETPGAPTILGEIFSESAKYISETIEEIPQSTFQIIHCSNEQSSKMVADKRLSILSFTGSDQVGWNLQTIAKGKKVCLELGGNAAVIVHKDSDIRRAVSRSIEGAFSYAGQVCISVQKVIIHKDIYNDFKRHFLEETAKVITGDPKIKDTIVGPLINRKARDRILSWIEEAQREGAKVLNAINASENILYPIVLDSVPSSSKLNTEEVFGPVVILDSYENFSEAVKKVNSSRFGLQVGVFTDSDKIMRHATEELEVGAIIFNEVPSFRADHMPYGGVKDSGLGREGIRYAMEEFSERKTIIKWRAMNANE